MAEFKLGRLRFVWKGAWTASTAYVRDDVVRYGGKVYVCVALHTASSNVAGGFYTDLNDTTPKWQLMNDGQAWASNWATSYYYKISDIVRYGGRSYICILGHTSASTAASGLEVDAAKWELLNDGIDYKGTWGGATRYKYNDLVTYGGQLYIVTTHHTSGGSFDPTKFTLFASGLQFEGAYNNGTTYQPGDVVSYGSNAFVATQTTVGNLPTDVAYWTPITTGIQFRGAYSNVTPYRKGDIVSYGPYSYVAKADTTGNVPDNATFWDLVVSGFGYYGTYAGGTTYQKGDTVGYGGYRYVAKSTTTGNLPTNATFWDVFTKGYTFIGTYAGGTAYKPGEIVAYGGSFYAAKADTTGNDPSNGTFWDVFSKGYDFKAAYSGGTTYKVGDIVSYGPRLYLAIQQGSGNLPTDTGYWSLFVDGVGFKGTYANATVYVIGDIVRYGGRAYVCILGHTSNTAGNIEPPNATYWALLSSGMSWKGTWSSATEYELDDVVEYSSSSWISVDSDNLNQQPDISPTKWNLVAQAGTLSAVLTTRGDMYVKNQAGAIARLPIGTEGQILVAAGGDPVWENNNYSANVYYVSPQGSNSYNGRSRNRAFLTIAYACTQVTGPATIYVAAGTYTEALPIIIPASVHICGDGQRTTIVQPQSGDETKQMFRMSNASQLSRITMTGLNGFVKSVGTPDDITAATLGGVFIALNSASAITTKSPYVMECAAISTGGIGAVVDGSLHGSGNKSIVFHSYTNIHDQGVGLWVSNGARAEVVSMFTYYCDFGYATTAGGVIRSLNGNNSYGLYGAVSSGVDASETPVTGALYGDMLTWTNLTLAGGSIAVGNVLQGLTSGTTARILNVQEASNRVIYKIISGGPFVAGETIRDNTTLATATIATGGVTGQKGYTVVVSGFSVQPQAGGSLTITGDATKYVIQAVSEWTASGTGYKPAGYAILSLTGDKTTASPDATAVSIRYRYSKLRLTGHDFLNIGTGGISTTNYPGTPSQAPSQVNEVVERAEGRVYYVSTDQDGNFRVGDYFKVDQATGRATLNASAFDLTGLTALRLGSIGAQIGESINEFSSDGTMSGNSNLAVPTEQAVKTYVDTQLNATYGLIVAQAVALGA